MVLALVGATATGKSALAMELARRRPGIELVSADSMQVYRGMDIGTAKPTPAQQAEVAHHLIDVADPAEEYAVSRYQADVAVATGDVARPVLVGGTGLYVRAVVDQLSIPGQYPDARREVEAEPDTSVLHRRLEALDPRASALMEPTNRRRVVRALEVTLGSGRLFSSYGPGLTSYPDTSTRLVGIRMPRELMDRRIEARYSQQLADGFVAEVESLARRPAGLSRTARQALGYKELLAHVDGHCSLDEAIEEAVLRTRRFARRQERWFRRDPRIHWLDADDKPARLVEPLLAHYDSCA